MWVQANPNPNQPDSIAKTDRAFKFEGKKPSFVATTDNSQKKVPRAIAPLVRFSSKTYKDGTRAILTRFLLPAMHEGKKYREVMKETREKFLSSNKNSEKIKLTTFDQAKLDGVVIFKDEKEKSDFAARNTKDQKWVILVNGNCQHYEDLLQHSQDIVGSDFKANVLTFNYRGVGQSEGKANKIEDLVVDADTCVQYLKDMGVPEENILISGHSLGGGIATKVASEYEKVNLLNTNSFASTAKAAEHLVAVPVIKNLVSKLIKQADWDLDAVEAWKRVKGRKMIVFHKDDKIISKPASLFKGLKLDKEANKAEKTAKESKFGGEYLKITKKISIYEEKFLNLPSIKHLILHEPNEFRKEVQLEFAEERRKILYREITTDPTIYTNKINEPLKRINLPELERASLFDKRFESVEAFKAALDNEIDIINEYLGKHQKTLPKEILFSIESLKNHLSRHKQDLDRLPKAEGHKPQTIDNAHNYPLSADEASWQRIRNFAQKVLGTAAG